MDILHIDNEKYLLEKMDLNFGRNPDRHGYYIYSEAALEIITEKSIMCVIYKQYL